MAAKHAAGATAKPMSFPLVDVLRAFAALSVVVYHVIEHFKWDSFPIEGVLVWFRIGWMGVDLFFVISGFVIGLSAFIRIDRSGIEGFRVPFIRHRLARIIPLHYLTCLIYVAFIVPELLFTHGFWLQILTHALFIHNFFLEHQGGINGVNWSLAAEMQFYLLILLIAPWLRRARWWVILLAGLGIAWIWRSIAFAVISTSGSWGVFPLFMVTTQLPGMLDEFAFGIVLARFVLSQRGKELMVAGARHPWALPLLACLSLWGMFTIFWMDATFWDSWLMVVLFRTLMALTWAVCILAAATIGSRLLLLLTMPLRYLGTISYGIYLWHLPVILALRRVSWLTADRALPVVIVLTLILASASWHCFERPLLLRFTRKGNQSVAGA
jgi:peptidoglycan/LPS O-acetylase OafA/YrhL